MQQHGIGGTLRFTGEPAEKVRGSKPIHAAKGYYDGLDGMISFHPFYMLPLCNTAALGHALRRCLCDDLPLRLRRAREPGARGDGAPIPQSHSAVRAPGANDALMMMYMASKALRDSMLPHQGGWSISEAILTAGQATADNLPAGSRRDPVHDPRADGRDGRAGHRRARPQRRSRRRHERLPLRAALGVEVAAGPRQPRHGDASPIEALSSVGAPRWDEAAKAIAREIQAMSASSRWTSPFIAECERLIEPQEAEAILRRDLPPSQLNSTSDDYTDMSWHAPTARFYVARPALRSPNGFAYPSWVMNALGGIAETIDPMVRLRGQDDRALCAAAARGQGRTRRCPARIRRAHRRRHRRRELDGAALRLRSADPLPLAGICHHEQRPRVVDPNYPERMIKGDRHDTA